MNATSALTKICTTAGTEKLDMELCQSVSSGINENNISFEDVIVALEPVITNTDVVVRRNGMEYLSNILILISPSFLNPTEISTLVKFYCDKIKDCHSIHPQVFKGYLALVQMLNIPDDVPLQILQHLVKYINCQTQFKSDRYVVYQIFNVLLETKLDNIKSMKEDAILGLYALMEGETDPKNLLFLFNFLPRFLSDFPIGNAAEDMFLLLSAYFPIDYNAARSNDLLITRDDLSKALKYCLCAVPEFSEFCVPLILEKLDSTLKVAKLDSYELLQECCNTFTVEGFANYLNDIWKYINKDVVPVTDKDICDAAVKALKCVIQLLSQNIEHQNILHEFLIDVISSTKPLLNRVDESLFQPSMNIVIAVCESSEIATRYMYVQLAEFFSPKHIMKPSEYKIFLSSLLPLIICGHKFKLVEANSLEGSSYSNLVNLFIECSDNANEEVQLVALSGLEILVPDLNEMQRETLYRIIINYLHNPHVNIRDGVLKVFRAMSKHFPTQSKDKVISQYLILNKDATVDNQNLANIVDALCRIADIQAFTPIIIPELLSLIQETNHYNVALVGLLKTCSQKEREDFHYVLYETYNIPSVLISWCLHHFTSDSTRTATSVDTLTVLSEIIHLTMGNFTQDKQQQIVDKFIPCILESCKVYSDSGYTVNMAENSIVSCMTKIVVLLEAMIAQIKIGVNIPFLCELYMKLMNICIKSSLSTISEKAARIISYIVNKGPEAEVVELISKSSHGIFQIINSEQTNMEEKVNSAVLFVWITKGINLRGLSIVDEWNKSLFEILGHSQVGQIVAGGFKSILDEDINLSSYSNIRILYRQRLYTGLPYLVKAYESSSNELKTNYLLALTYLIQGVPKCVILTDIFKIIQLLVECLESEEPVILEPTLATFQSLLKDKEDFVCDQIGTFLPRFLKISQLECSMKIRIAVLQCVYLYSFYSTHLILPFRQSVLSNLLSCLDDKKRLVRSEAVKARGRWFLVGAPGEEAST